MKIFRIVGGMVAEYVQMEWLQVLSWFYPDPPQEWKNGTKGDIILIPGFYEPWTFFRFLGYRLNEKGYRIRTIPGLHGRMSVAEAAVEVEGFMAKEGLTDVVLLSHCKGGLVAKYCMDQLDHANRVARSVSLSTPYGGTRIGHLRILGLGEMMPSSRLIREMMHFSSNNHKILQLYVAVDNHVLPNANLVLAGAQNIRIDCVGHTRILEDERTYEAIIRALE